MTSKQEPAKSNLHRISQSLRDSVPTLPELRKHLLLRTNSEGTKSSFVVHRARFSSRMGATTTSEGMNVSEMSDMFLAVEVDEEQASEEL